MDVICKILFGSHLYGTDTPDSDKDYKGIFMPTIEDLILQRVPKTINLSTNKSSEKNTKDDVDYELYSLPYFLELACQGETVALDMLHAPKECVLQHSDIWYDIVSNRSTFYTKNLKAFVGYARKQAAKYGIKGSRLNTVQKVVDFLKSFDPDKQLKDYSWAWIPNDLEHCRGWIDDKGIRGIEICGKKFQETTPIKYILKSLEKFLNDYGHRARQAAENKGIDWKAISHALRAAYQVKSILVENTIVFPLPEAGRLKAIKLGVLDYTTKVAPHLEYLMGEVEYLSDKSTLPEKVDRKFWDKKLVGYYGF
jgi:hypothetical protein